MEDQLRTRSTPQTPKRELEETIETATPPLSQEDTPKADEILNRVYDHAQRALTDETGQSTHSDPVSALISYAQIKSKEVRELAEYKKRAENVISSVVQLLKQQVNYHSIFNASSVAEDIVALDGRIVDCNLSFTRLLGYTRSKILNDPSVTVYNITHPDSFTHTYFFVQSILTSRNQVLQTIKKYIAADGRAVWARVTAWITNDEAGKPRVIRAVLEPYVPPASNSSHTSQDGGVPKSSERFNAKSVNTETRGAPFDFHPL